MTMVTTRSEAQPLGSPESYPDREPPGADLLAADTPHAEGSGHRDAPRADLWGVRTWRPPAPRLGWGPARRALLPRPPRPPPPGAGRARPPRRWDGGRGSSSVMPTTGPRPSPPGARSR